MFRTAIIAAASVLTLSAGVAAAQDAPSMSVSASGLDLQSAAGAASYLQRVKDAAAKVCGNTSYVMHTEQDDVDACVKETTADAVAATEAPLVTALYAHRPSEIEMAEK